MSTFPEVPAANQNRRVAVIAIHGVGDHPPFAMANDVSNLLADLETPAANAPAKPRYSNFEERRCRIKVAPLQPPGRYFPTPGETAHAKHMKEKNSWGPLDSLYKSWYATALGRSPVDQLDHIFMEGQISQYQVKGPEDTFEVQRLEGRRLFGTPPPTPRAGEQDREPPHLQQTAQDASAEKDVHIYDMYWSDISGVGSQSLAVFGELYQLLFHLGGIGVNNVRAAALHYRGTRGERFWDWFCRFALYTAATLAWPIALLNLLMLVPVTGLLAAALLRVLSPAHQRVTVVGGLALAASVVYALVLTAKRRGVSLIWFLAAGLVTAIAALVLLAVGSIAADWPDSAAAIVGSALAFAVSVRAAFAYERRRPGSLRAFWITAVFYALCVIAAIVWRSQAGTWPAAYVSMALCVTAVEAAFWPLMASWGVFGVLFLITWILGYFAARTAKHLDTEKAEHARRARRTAKTAWVTVAVSTAIFMTVTFVGWTMVTNAVLAAVPHDECASLAKGTPQSEIVACQERRAARNADPPMMYRPFFGSEPVTLETAAADLMDTAGSKYAFYFVVLLAAAVLIALWALGPIVWREVSPPRQPKRGGNRRDLARLSTLLGTWLDTAFVALTAPAVILALVAILAPVFIAFAIFQVPIPKGPKFGLEIGSGGLAVGGAGLLLLRGRFAKAAAGFRTAVRVAIDVDNWLREHPRDENPTARICARYASLLRRARSEAILRRPGHFRS